MFFGVLAEMIQGEVSWYFTGREAERRIILGWLESKASGLFVLTGRAGAGKSALLGDILVRSRSDLARVLLDHGFLEPIAPWRPRTGGHAPGRRGPDDARLLRDKETIGRASEVG
jgi:hypothetical protein